jgi:hypothetical protein
MKFPFSITNSIVLNQKDYGISSEKFILRIIDEHMTQYGMELKKYPENEFYYYKLDPLNLLRTKDLIRNLSIKVKCTDDEIIVVLQTQTIVFFFLAILALFLPFTFGGCNLRMHLIFAVMFIVVPYSIKAITLRSIKKEVKNNLIELKK